MRRRIAAPLLFAALTAVFLASGTRTAQAQPDPETFLTADGVQLRGVFEPSKLKPETDPVVILLYPPGKDNNMDKGDWKGLSAELAGKGYSVFRFDWRGHGKSTDIKDTETFWNLSTVKRQNPNPFTGPWHTPKMITGAPQPGKKIKDDLFFKDLKTPDRYMPVYLLDLAAARHHLDLKNNRGRTNTSSIYLIGAESAATIGMAWITTEWERPATAPLQNQLVGFGGLPIAGGFPTYKYVPQPLNGGVGIEAGKDITGAVWLSPIRPMSINTRSVQDWVKRAPRLRDTTPMLFLYGPDDTKAKDTAKFFFEEVLVAKPKPGITLQKLDQTFEQPVKGAGKLSGVSLLGAGTPKTEETITTYLAAVRKSVVARDPQPRNYTEPWFIELANIPGLAQGFGFTPP